MGRNEHQSEKKKKPSEFRGSTEREFSVDAQG